MISLFPQHIHRFLHSLRSLIRDSTASVFISLPTHLAHQAPVTRNQKGKSPAYEPLLTPEGWLKSLGWASDACIEFQGFAGELTVLCLARTAVLTILDARRPILERRISAQSRACTGTFAANNAHVASSSAKTFIAPWSRSRIDRPEQPRVQTQAKALDHRNASPRCRGWCRRETDAADEYWGTGGRQEDEQGCDGT